MDICAHYSALLVFLLLTLSAFIIHSASCLLSHRLNDLPRCELRTTRFHRLKLKIELKSTFLTKIQLKCLWCDWSIETRRGAGLIQSRLSICVCKHCDWCLVQACWRWWTRLSQLLPAMSLPCTVLYSSSATRVQGTILQVRCLPSLPCIVVLLLRRACSYFCHYSLCMSLFVLCKLHLPLLS